MSRLLKQIAALPMVGIEGETHILLITTRGRGRWTIPKGWPKSGMADVDMAAKEAAQEAGVEGYIGAQPLGCFGYTKHLHLFFWARCHVEVYPLYVRVNRVQWREKAARKMCWAAPDEAASLVADTELASLLRSLFRSKAA